MHIQRERERNRERARKLGAQLLTKLKVKTVYFLYFVLNL